MESPRTTLEQWRVLQAVVEAGSFAAAATAIHRSQSAVSYTVARLQEQLGVTLLRQEGRRSVLTAAGEALLRESGPMIEGLLRLEARAHGLGQGWEAEVRLAVDSILPTTVLVEALAEFAGTCPDTRILLREEVLSGTDDALFGGEADVAIGSRVPPGFLGDRLLEVPFIAAAHPKHPLHRLGHPLTEADLARSQQIVVRDSGRREPRDEGWLGTPRRWTVSSGETALELVCGGLGFAWFPQHRVMAQIQAGTLKVLPMAAGAVWRTPLYLIFADPEAAGPATRALAAILRRQLAET